MRDFSGGERVQDLVAQGAPHEVRPLREVEDVAAGGADDGAAREGPQLGEDAEEGGLTAEEGGERALE